MISPGSPILTAAAMRAAERAVMSAGTSQDALMERAGGAVAREVARFAAGRPILILAGPGNNGGDAYVCARLMAEKGGDVVVAALGCPSDGAAGRTADRWTGDTVSLSDAPSRPIVVDGLFGTGLSRKLDEDGAATLRRCLTAAEFSLAIDLPSGVATDSGDDLGATRVSATLALGAIKPAHVIGDGAALCGQVLLADLGVPAASRWTTLARSRLNKPAPHANKYRAMVAVIGGAMPGAAALAATAAARGSAGYVLLLASERQPGVPHAIVQRQTLDADALEKALDDDRIGAGLIGPGLGRDDQARRWLDAALASDRPLVIDGDALSLLGESAPARIAARDADTILTPHSGEFDRTFGEGQGSKIDRTMAAARSARATIVHKGHATVIAHPDGRATVSTGGTTWLATAGTGDVLAGLVATRLADGSAQPAEEAVWLHARTAELAGPAFVADSLAEYLRTAIAECL